MDTESTITDKFNAAIDRVIERLENDRQGLDTPQKIQGMNPYLFEKARDFLRRHTAGYLSKHYRKRPAVRTIERIHEITDKALIDFLSSNDSELPAAFEEPNHDLDVIGKKDFLDTDITELLRSAYLLTSKSHQATGAELFILHAIAAYDLGRYQGLYYDSRSKAGQKFIARLESSRKNEIKNYALQERNLFIRELFVFLPDEDKNKDAATLSDEFLPRVRAFIKNAHNETLKSGSPAKTKQKTITKETLAKIISEIKTQYFIFNKNPQPK